MNILLVGCGKKFGRTILDSLVQRGHSVHSISSVDVDGVNNILIDWDTLNPAVIERQLQQLPRIDFVFFNAFDSFTNYSKTLIGSMIDRSKWIDSDVKSPHFKNFIENEAIKNGTTFKDT